jgi:CRP-like cAMP-binding protein
VSQRHQEPQGNRLPAILPREEMKRLRPHLERVSFALGEVVYESGGRQSYIYFPTTAIISLLYLMENGSSAEMGVAGNEGLSASPSTWEAVRCPTRRSCRAPGAPSG